MEFRLGTPLELWGSVKTTETLTVFALASLFAFGVLGAELPRTQLQQVSFSARTRLDPESTKLFHLQIGRNNAAQAGSPLLAVIHDHKGNRVAHCTVTRIEKLHSRVPKLMNLDCSVQSSLRLGPNLSISWEKNGVLLKGGSWLESGPSVPLEVERDLFSMPQVPRDREKSTLLAQRGSD